MVNNEQFLVCVCVGISKKENLAGLMLKYASGSVLRKYKLCEIDLRTF